MPGNSTAPENSALEVGDKSRIVRCTVAPATDPPTADILALPSRSDKSAVSVDAWLVLVSGLVAAVLVILFVGIDGIL